jgi:hypothetical protein
VFEETNVPFVELAVRFEFKYFRVSIFAFLIFTEVTSPISISNLNSQIHAVCSNPTCEAVILKNRFKRPHA